MCICMNIIISLFNNAIYFTSYPSQKILGPPDAFPFYGSYYETWSPSYGGDNVHFIEVFFVSDDQLI